MDTQHTYRCLPLVLSGLEPGPWNAGWSRFSAQLWAQTWSRCCSINQDLVVLWGVRLHKGLRTLRQVSTLRSWVFYLFICTCSYGAGCISSFVASVSALMGRRLTCCMPGLVIIPSFCQRRWNWNDPAIYRALAGLSFAAVDLKYLQPDILLNQYLCPVANRVTYWWSTLDPRRYEKIDSFN